MDRRRRGPVARRGTTTFDRAVRAVPLPRRRGASPSAARASGDGCATAFALDPDTPGLATNAERVADRSRVIEVVESVFATWDAEPLLARLSELGVPAGKVRTLDEVYAWDQTAGQGLLVDVDHPPWAG